MQHRGRWRPAQGAQHASPEGHKKEEGSEKEIKDMVRAFSQDQRQVSNEKPW